MYVIENRRKSRVSASWGPGSLPVGRKINDPRGIFVIGLERGAFDLARVSNQKRGFSFWHMAQQVVSFGGKLSFLKSSGPRADQPNVP